MDSIEKRDRGIYFRGYGGKPLKKYPCWRYHKVLQPIVVHDTAEDEAAQKRDFYPINIPITANKNIVNWIWDLEDLSPKQLVIYAHEEYEVDLPIEAGQEKLLKAILELGKHAPQNENRLVLMAHTIKMNYDETLEEIRRVAHNGMSEVETREVVL